MEPTPLEMDELDALVSAIQNGDLQRGKGCRVIWSYVARCALMRASGFLAANNGIGSGKEAAGYLGTICMKAWP